MLAQENFEMYDALWCILGNSGSISCWQYNGDNYNTASHMHKIRTTCAYAAFRGSAQTSATKIDAPRRSRHYLTAVGRTRVYIRSKHIAPTLAATSLLDGPVHSGDCCPSMNPTVSRSGPTHFHA